MALFHSVAPLYSPTMTLNSQRPIWTAYRKLAALSNGLKLGRLDALGRARIFIKNLERLLNDIKRSVNDHYDTTYTCEPCTASVKYRSKASDIPTDMPVISTCLGIERPRLMTMPEPLNSTCRIGFNSCYHLTDVPAFVSGSTLVYFDPHCTNLPVTASNPGMRANFTKADLLSRYPDQCRTFQVFGCNMREAFPGTIFRLPLRTAQLAEKSRLSKQVCFDDGLCLPRRWIYQAMA